jgi:hypothetical protein
MVGISLIFIGCFMNLFGKAVSDVVDNTPVWEKSIFSNLVSEKTDFFGPKDETWIRKRHPNKLLKFLLSTIFVSLTDVWHLGNLVRHSGVYISILGALLCSLMIEFSLEFILLLMGGYILLTLIGFHTFYHYILRKTI